MQLIELKVLKDETVIREITFQDGVNFITTQEKNGNQIGKSTALRVVNFCLGSKGDSIWKDPDSKTTNQEIKELVTSGRVTFLLVMCIDGITYNIKRQISVLRQKKQTILKRHSWINGSEYNTNEKFNAALAPILGLTIKNPTYSAMKNRFVRLDKKTSNDVYRYLHLTTSDSEYILYYSFLFGFEGHEKLTLESELIRDKTECKNRINTLLNGKNEQAYKDKLQSIDDEIELLNQKEEEFDFKDSQNKGILKLKKQRQKISELTSSITRLEIRINYAQRTIDSYEKQKSDIDVNLIETIYKEAKSILPNLSKTLKETISFHEQIISKKTAYLLESISEYKVTQEIKQRELDELLIEEQSLIKAILNESHLSGFIIIEKEIQDKREERGRTSVIIDEVSYEASKIKSLEVDVESIRKQNQVHMKKFRTNIDIFNGYLKKFTRALFNDFSLSFNAGIDSSTNELEFSIVNLDKVAGDGSPRAAALAFDMALVEFVKNTNRHLPKFTLQDHLEASDQDKLATLATIANKNNIQVVMSILPEKLSFLSPAFIKSNTVLSLAKSDKFFGI